MAAPRRAEQSIGEYLAPMTPDEAKRELDSIATAMRSSTVTPTAEILARVIDLEEIVLQGA